MKTVSMISFAVILLACSSEKDDVSTKDDAAGTCTNLCVKAGYKSGRADVQPNEINCFCTDGTTAVPAADCMNMCNALGKAKSQVFISGGTVENSCQCS